MAKPPIWFWIVGILALLWEASGCYIYYAEVTAGPAALAAMGDYARAIIEQRPWWATAGFAIGTWGSLLAAILLLMRKAAAVPLFLIALLGIIVSYGWTLLMSGQVGHFGGGDWGLVICIMVIQAALLWFANYAKTRKWIG